MDTLDSRYLDGLTVNDVDVLDGPDDDHDEGNCIYPKRIPIIRDATMDDVLNWADHGDTITIITSDGQRHVVAKLEE